MFRYFFLLLGLSVLGACATKPKQKLMNTDGMKVAEILGYEYTYPSLRVYAWNLGCSDQKNFDYSLEPRQELKVFHLYRPQTESCYKTRRQMYIDFELGALVREDEVLVITLDATSI